MGMDMGILIMPRRNLFCQPSGAIRVRPGRLKQAEIIVSSVKF
jgi:hypothetical protein